MSETPPTYRARKLRTIEEEIGQTKPFTSQRHRALVNLMFTYGWHLERMRERMEPYGITVQQYNVLRILRGAREPISTSIIRSRMLDRMSDTSRLVDRLHKKGLVKRRTCPSDKRLVDISISDEGLQLMEDLDRREKNFVGMADGITEADAETLNTLLDRLRCSS